METGGCILLYDEPVDGEGHDLALAAGYSGLGEVALGRIVGKLPDHGKENAWAFVIGLAIALTPWLESPVSRGCKSHYRAHSLSTRSLVVVSI